MRYFSLILSIALMLISSSLLHAQDPCGCSAKGQQAATSGDPQVVTQCQSLIFNLCRCRCADDPADREQLKKMLDYSRDVLKTFRDDHKTPIGPCDAILKELERNGGDYKCVDPKKGAPNTQGTTERTVADNNNDAVQFANNLGTLTNDENAKKELEKINKRHETFGALKSTASTAGATDEQLKMIDNAEAVAHLGSFFFGQSEAERLAQVAKSEREAASHNAVADKIEVMRKYLHGLHTQKIPDYDNITAKHRLLVLRRMNVKDKTEDSEYFTMDDFQKMINRIEEESKNGVDYIKARIDDEASKKKYNYREYDYLRNHRTNDSSDGLRAFILPATFTPATDKLYKIEQRGKATLLTFMIIDSEYKVVLETSDVNKGWDGNFRKKPSAAGICSYVFDGYDSDGQYFYKRGEFILVR